MGIENFIATAMNKILKNLIESGNDTMNGGTGNDTYIVDSSSDVVIENLNEGVDIVKSSASYTLSSNVENLTLTGTVAINGTGNSLDNTIIGNTANNILNGEAGNDTLDGGAGNDILIGETGNDTYIVDSSSDVVIENLNEGVDTVKSSASYVLGDNIENLTLTGTAAINGTGNSLDNTIIGNTANNILKGEAGNDYLDGGSGNDIYKFNLGSNKDAISDNSGTDNIQFDSTVSKSNIAFYLQGNKDLAIQYSTNDSIMVSSWSTATNKIEKVSLSDGNYLSSSDVDRLIQSMSAYASTKGISLSSIDSVSKNADLMTMIASSWHK